jgi:hypothetical protein
MENSLPQSSMIPIQMDFSQFSSVEFQTYGMQHATQFEYRIELARRIASTFQVQHLIILEDVALTVSQSERATSFFAVQVMADRHPLQ